MKFNSEVEFVDDTGGYGSGIISNLNQAGHSPIPINFSGKATNPNYYNKRMEMWWNMTQWIKKGGVLPPVRSLAAELSTPTYTMKNGRMILEPKELIKSRLGYSPDFADALALTFAHDEAPGVDPVTEILRRTGKVKLHQTEWDPTDEDRM